MPKPPYIITAGGVRQGTVNRPGDHRVLRLPLTDLSFIRIDFQTRLQFEDTQVVIGSPFVLRVGGIVYDLDPEDRSELGPILDLYPSELHGASVNDAASLTLRFAGGASITVHQDPRYEAWQVSGPGGYLVVCTPGTDGELAVWEDG